MTWPFVHNLQRIVDALVNSNFGELTGPTCTSRLSVQDIRLAIEAYGRTLVPLPDEALARIDVVPVANATPRVYSVRVPLWTVEEGQSDLTLEVTVSQTPYGYFVELDDLHVL